jgi:hypothetical protein
MANFYFFEKSFHPFLGVGLSGAGGMVFGKIFPVPIDIA